MELEKLNVRLVKLPPDIEITLYLIKQELKTAKLFNGLAKVGLGDCFFECHFDTIVLALMGFDERPDDLHNFYTKLIDQYSEKMEADTAEITQRAFDVYAEMMIEKKKRKV